MSEPQRVGRPVAYCAARLQPREGARKTADEVFDDYVAWCQQQNLMPLRAGVFREKLAAVIAMADIPKHADWSDLVLLDTDFASPARKR
jgi:hypothetical protein